MEEITLQLRQAESGNVQQNGVYSTTLEHPIELRPGDEVAIKSVFLDTTDVIHIPVEGLSVSLTGCKYLVNYNINQKYNYVQAADAGVDVLFDYGGPGPGGSLPTTGDNEIYWLGDAIASSAHVPYFVQNVNVIPKTKHQVPGKRYGGCDIPIQFTDPAFPDKPFAGRATLHVASYEIDRYHKHNPVPVPSQARKVVPTAFTTFTCASVDDIKQIRVEPNFPLFQYNIDHIEFIDTQNEPAQPIQPAGDSYIIYPQYFTWTATLSGGDYTPTEISAALNDLLTPVEYSGPTGTDYNKNTGGAEPVWDPSETKFPVNSPFMETVLQNNYNLSVQAAADGNTHTQCFINASRKDPTAPDQLAANAGTIPRQWVLAKMIAEFAVDTRPPVDRYMGTNQISMSFDEAERKLKWDLLHFPIATNSSTVADSSPVQYNNDAKPGLQYSDLTGLGVQANALSGIAKAYGGIAFTAMEPQSFWGEQLGFLQSTIQVQQNVVSCNFPEEAAGVPNSFQIENAVAGATITEAAATLDVAVVNSSAPLWTNGGTNGQPGRFAQPRFSSAGNSLAEGGNGSQVSTNDTIACFASKTYNDSIQDDGYFLVDVAHNFNTEFVGGSLGNKDVGQNSASNTGNDTMSIVSRYYTSNNFVTDQGAGTIIYQHSGAPQSLTDLAIRVKNPDGSFVSETVLREKNTVFITIKRAKKIVNLSNVPPPTKEEEKDMEIGQ